MKTSEAIGNRVSRRSGNSKGRCNTIGRLKKSAARVSALRRPAPTDGSQLTRGQLNRKLQRKIRELERLRKAFQKLVASKKETEERLNLSFREIARVKAAFDQHAIVAITDAQGKITYANDLFCRISKYSREELLGQDHRIVNSGTHPKELFKQLWGCITRGGVWKGEICNRAKDGSLYWVDCTIVPFLNREGKPTQYIAIRSEITERKRAEEQLRASLLEKDTLLKETHHRVKNNLQLISSLLHMQAQYVQNPEALTAFRDSENRIRSMALIHEKLYGSDSVARIDFAEYVRSLSAMHARTFHSPEQDFDFDFCLMPIHLNLETAIPLAIIFSELISNSLKHAFAGMPRGTVRIRLAREADDKIILSVTDNGRGIPEDFDWKQAHTLGLRLLRLLTEQLHGSITLKRGNGTEFVVTAQEWKPKTQI
jgi:PAS domain S-box-containing protein